MSTARKSTVAHMQRLAAAALVTNVAACEHMCSHGYAVVDPMPIPARMPGVASSMTATVSLTGTRVVLEVKDPTMAGTSLVAKTSDAGAGYSIVGGRIARMVPTSDGLRFEIEPDVDRGALNVRFDVDGRDGSGTVEAYVDWGTTPDGGRDVQVTLYDR